jgi:hypothetical protein
VQVVAGVADGGGALWWARAPAGASPPVLLRRFEGLKPEGVALSPRRGLAVIFDRDRQPPVWMELPAPRP